jgi:ATP-binding cassette subfamily F protein 3
MGSPDSGLSRKVQRQNEAERRKRLKPLLNKLKKAEQTVEKFHTEQKNLETQLADSEIYSDSNKAKLKKLLAQKINVDKALEQSEEEWMILEELLEQENL